MPPRVKRGLRKFLADPIKRSKTVHAYRGNVDAANKFWKICENENTKVITYQIDPDNELLGSLVRKCDKKEKQILINYLKELTTNLPINHIYEKMSERPKDINQGEIEMKALEVLLDRVFQE